MNGGWGISYKIALRWMPLALTYDKSTLIQIMAWCRQATHHYLNQCWPRSMSLNGVTRPQWVNHQQHWSNSNVSYFSVPEETNASTIKKTRGYFPSMAGKVHSGWEKTVKIVMPCDEMVYWQFRWHIWISLLNALFNDIIMYHRISWLVQQIIGKWNYFVMWYTLSAELHIKK